MTKDFYKWLVIKYGEVEAKRRYKKWRQADRSKIDGEQEPKKGGQQTLA